MVVRRRAVPAPGAGWQTRSTASPHGRSEDPARTARRPTPGPGDPGPGRVRARGPGLRRHTRRGLPYTHAARGSIGAPSTGSRARTQHGAPDPHPARGPGAAHGTGSRTSTRHEAPYARGQIAMPSRAYARAFGFKGPDRQKPAGSCPVLSLFLFFRTRTTSRTGCSPGDSQDVGGQTRRQPLDRGGSGVDRFEADGQSEAVGFLDHAAHGEFVDHGDQGTTAAPVRCTAKMLGSQHPGAGHERA